MPTVRERAEALRIELRTKQRYVGPPILVASAAPHREVLVAGAKPSLLDALPAHGPTTTVQLDRQALEADLGDHSGSMVAIIELVAGDSELHELTLPEGRESLRVGRDPESDILIQDVTISTVHAVLERRDGRWYLRDAGSSNGTYVNKRSLEPGQEAALVGGDCVRFGDRVFYFLTGARLAFFFAHWLG